MNDGVKLPNKTLKMRTTAPVTNCFRNFLMDGSITPMNGCGKILHTMTMRSYPKPLQTPALFFSLHLQVQAEGVGGCHPIAAIAAVARRRSGLRPVGLELFLLAPDQARGGEKEAEVGNDLWGNNFWGRRMTARCDGVYGLAVVWYGDVVDWYSEALSGWRQRCVGGRGYGVWADGWADGMVRWIDGWMDGS